MIPPPYDAWFVFGLLALMLVGFITERLRADVIAISGAAVLLAAGLLDPGAAVAVFANEAPITIGCMFVLSAALERTGALEVGGKFVMTVARHSPLVSLGFLMGGTMVISAFINNTPVVVVLTPITIMLANSLSLSPSRFLIPLSYASILGGTCTLIGTSTNLIANGVARDMGLEGFGLFDITSIGLIYGLVGLLYMVSVGYRLLPDREVFSSVMAGTRHRQFLTEVLIPFGSPLVGKTVVEAELGKGLGVRVMDLIRNRISFALEMDKLTIKAGDRLVLRTNMADVMSLRDKSDVLFGSQGQHAIEPIASQNSRIMEGIVGPRSRLAGQRLADLNLRRQYGVYIMAVHRHGENLGGNFDLIRLNFGDTIMLEGPPDGLRVLFETGALVSLSEPADRPARRDRAWLAITALVAVVLLAMLDVMPISGLAMIAAAAVILGGCLDPDEAYQAVNWPILFLIFGMLGVGEAMRSTGAGQLLVDQLMALVSGYGPVVVLSMIYLITTILTEFISNNATAILMTPIAIGVAHQIGVAPEPFVIAVMFAASASFSTPIGYQTNTFVYSAGGYKFRDFVLVGVPLNLTLWLVASFVIPRIWPFTPG